MNKITFARKRRLFNSLVWIIPMLMVFTACGGGSSSTPAANNNNNPPPAGSNNAPTNVDAGAAQTVWEGATVNLSGSGDDPEDGANVTFSWAQTGGTPAVTILNGDTATPSFMAPEVAADTDLTFQLTVTDTEGASTTDNVVITVTNVPPLTVTTNVSPANTVDLTAMGDLDWIHMGRTGTAAVRKDIATALIGPPTKIDNASGSPGGPYSFPDAWVGYTWSDGAGGDVQADPTTSGVFYSMAQPVDHVGQGYSIQVEAGVQPRTVTLYLGGLQAEGTLTATLSDDPGNPQSVVLTSESSSGFTRAVSFTFKAQTVGATLDIQYVLTDDFGTDSNLTFQAAALSSVAQPVIAPAGGVITNSALVSLTTATAGAEIRYTLNGSDPTTGSTLYTGPFTVDDTTGNLVRARAFLNSQASTAAAADFTVNVSADTILTATVGLPVTVSDGSLSPETQVILSDEGTVDWMHRGQDSAGDIDRKAGVTAQIADLTKISNGSGDPGGPYQMDDAPIFYFWTGGTGPDEVDGTTNGVFFSMAQPVDHIGQGFTTTVEATTTLRTLKLYLGGFQAVGQVTATLGTQTASVSFGNEFGSFTRVVTLTFQAPAADQVTINYTLNDDYTTDSNLTFQAATLAE